MPRAKKTAALSKEEVETKRQMDIQKAREAEKLRAERLQREEEERKREEEKRRISEQRRRQEEEEQQRIALGLLVIDSYFKI